MKITVQWNNISLALALLLLLWFFRLILRSVTLEELTSLVLPGEVNLTRVRYLVTLGVLVTAAVGLIALLKTGGKDS